MNNNKYWMVSSKLKEHLGLTVLLPERVNKLLSYKSDRDWTNLTHWFALWVIQEREGGFKIGSPEEREAFITHAAEIARIESDLMKTLSPSSGTIDGLEFSEHVGNVWDQIRPLSR